jgi:cytochrome c
LTQRPGFLRITTQQGGLLYSSNNAKNVLVQNAPTAGFEIQTRLLFTPTEDYQQAGLLVYQDDDNFLMLIRLYCSPSPPLCVGNGIYFYHEVQGTPIGSSFPTTTTAPDEAYLRLVRDGEVYTGYVSEDGVDWTMLGQHTVSAGFMPAKIGVFASAGIQEAAEIPADFDFFSVTGDLCRVFLPIIMKGYGPTW